MPVDNAAQPGEGDASASPQLAEQPPVEPLFELAPFSRQQLTEGASDRNAWWVVWGVALLAWIATLLWRGIEPALPSIWTGIGTTITAVKLVAAYSSQLLAVLLCALVILAVLLTLVSRLPIFVRVFSVAAGALVILAVMVSSAVRLPHLSRLLVGLGAGLVALAAAAAVAQLLSRRAASLAIAVVALAGVLRLAAVGAGLGLLSGAAPIWENIARGFASASLLVELLAVGVAAVWLVTQPGSSGRRSYAGGAAALLALLMCVVWVGTAMLGGEPQATGGSLLISRASRSLMLTPEPFFPPVVPLLVRASAFSLALAILVRRPRSTLMAAAVAMALVAGASLEIPLSAGLLLVGALALANHPPIELAQHLRELRAADES